MERLRWKYLLILPSWPRVAVGVTLLMQYLKRTSGTSRERGGAERKANASKTEAAPHPFGSIAVKSLILTWVKFKNNPDRAPEAADAAVCLTPWPTAFVPGLCKQATGGSCSWWNWKTWFETATSLLNPALVCVPYYTAFHFNELPYSFRYKR